MIPLIDAILRNRAQSGVVAVTQHAPTALKPEEHEGHEGHEGRHAPHGSPTAGFGRARGRRRERALLTADGPMPPAKWRWHESFRGPARGSCSMGQRLSRTSLAGSP